MKRNNIVLNRALVQRGRRLAKWMASRPIGDAEMAAKVQLQCRALVANPALCQALAQASDTLADEMDIRGGYITQTMVHAVVDVVVDGDHRSRLALLDMQ